MKNKEKKCFKLLSIGLLCGCIWGFTGRQATATPLTFNFEAQATGVSDPTGFLGPSFGVGSIITGTYAFDSNAPDIDPYPGDGYERYASNGAGFGINMVAGSRSFYPIVNPGLPELMILTIDKPSSDSYILSTQTITVDGIDPFKWSTGDNFVSLELGLPASALDSGGLPLNPDELFKIAASTSFLMDLILRDPNNGNFLGEVYVRGGLNSITSTMEPQVPAPEPASMFLLGTGLAGIILVRGIGKRV